MKSFSEEVYINHLSVSCPHSSHIFWKCNNRIFRGRDTYVPSVNCYSCNEFNFEKWKLNSSRWLLATLKDPFFSGKAKGSLRSSETGYCESLKIPLELRVFQLDLQPLPFSLGFFTKKKTKQKKKKTAFRHTLFFAYILNPACACSMFVCVCTCVCLCTHTITRVSRCMIRAALKLKLIKCWILSQKLNWP